jgi:hypothetical protein
MVYRDVMKVRSLVFLGAAILLGCLEVVPPQARVLSAQLTSDGIDLLNHSDKVLYTFAADLDTLEVLEDWVPCVEVETCEGIPPGDARLTPFEGIRGWSLSTRDVVVLHWFLVPDGAGFKADTIRGLRLRLQ